MLHRHVLEMEVKAADAVATEEIQPKSDALVTEETQSKADEMMMDENVDYVNEMAIDEMAEVQFIEYNGKQIVVCT